MKSLVLFLSFLSNPLEYIGAVASSLPTVIKKKGIRRRDFFYYLDLCGACSLPIVLLICYLMGLVLGLQAALQLRKVGTEIFIADLVGFSVLKEFGPLMVAMIATGRASSAFAAEIGTMQVNEEVSALKTMGINPIAYLVFPKLLALFIAMPLLTIFGDVAGLLGGLTVSYLYLDIPISVYCSRTIAVLDNTTLFLGIVKAAIFSILITLSGCFCGFNSAKDAQGVGRGATQAVVAAIFLIIIADALLTLLYSCFGY